MVAQALTILFKQRNYEQAVVRGLGRSWLTLVRLSRER